VVLVGKAFPDVVFHKRKCGERCNRKNISILRTMRSVHESEVMHMHFWHYRVPLHFSHALETYLGYRNLIDWRVMMVYNTGHPISRPQSPKSVTVRVEDVVYQKGNGNRKWISPSHFRCCKQDKGQSYWCVVSYTLDSLMIFRLKVVIWGSYCEIRSEKLYENTYSLIPIFFNIPIIINR
jgi:hypothetical protein